MSASLTLELKGINLDAVEQARAAISGAIASPDLQKLLSGGAFETALGGLGAAFGSLKASTPDATALFKPLVDASGSILAGIDTSKLPLAAYAEAVGEGAKIVMKFVDAMQLDPASIGKILPFDQMDKLIDAMTGGFNVAGDPIGTFRTLVNRVEAGVPVDPEELAKLALDVLLPFGGASLVNLRGSIDVILNGSASITFPKGRFAGLLLALDGIELAAKAGNVQLVAKGLADFERVRRSTIEVVTSDLLSIRNAIASLRVAETLAPLVGIAGNIRTGEDGLLETLERFRGYIAMARVELEGFDGRRIPLFLESMIAVLEREARLRIEKPIDDSVAATKVFVRGLFSHLPLRSLREEISGFLTSIAKGITDAHLDVVAKEIHEAIDAIDKALDPATLATDVQSLLAGLTATLEGVVDGIKSALGKVVDAIKAVEAQLQEALQKVVAVLNAFSASMTAITDAVNSIDIEGATDQTLSSIREVRATAETLFGAVPLPEPMKPMVEQVIATLESIELEVVFAPVEAVIAQIKVPPEVKAKVTAGLKEVEAKLKNAIPEQLIKSIDDEIRKALDTIAGFDPAKLLDGVRKYLDEAADFLESIDVLGKVETIGAPFQKVLDGIDFVAPHKLLAPVISAYDSLLGKITPPPLDDFMGKITGGLDSFGTAATQKFVAPLAELTGAKADVAGTSGAAAGGGGTAGGGAGASASGGAQTPSVPTAPDGSALRPGDVIRVLGWLPAKLREGLKALDATAAGDALRSLDSFTIGLARDLRLVRHRLLAINTRIEAALEQELAPVAAAQLRAQLALQLNVSAPGFNVNASVTAVGTVNPGAMRKELAASLGELRGGARNAFEAASGEAGSALEQAALALESFRLARILTSVDDLLAALDPEPIAAELDALAEAAIRRAPEILDDAVDALGLAIERIGALVRELNPGTQALKFLKVLDVLRQELDVLNPRFLADDLSLIHRALRAAVAAYDPRVLAADVDATIKGIAAKLRALDVTQILGDLDLFAPIVAAIEEANPATVLKNVGASLAEVGGQLAALDPAGMLTSVETLIPNIEASFRKAIETIIAEIIALLQAIKYASGSASVSVEATVTT